MCWGKLDRGCTRRSQQPHARCNKIIIGDEQQPFRAVQLASTFVFYILHFCIARWHLCGGGHRLCRLTTGKKETFNNSIIIMEGCVRASWIAIFATGTVSRLNGDDDVVFILIEMLNFLILKICNSKICNNSKSVLRHFYSCQSQNFRSFRSLSWEKMSFSVSYVDEKAFEANFCG